MTGEGKAAAVAAALQQPVSGTDASASPARLVRPIEGGSSMWLMDAPAASSLGLSISGRALVATDASARAVGQ